LVFLLVGVAIQIFAAIQRFHDLNRSGWQTFLLLIPLFNLYLIFTELVSKEGQAAVNPYGSRKGEVVYKRTIELLFVGLIFVLVVTIL